MLIMEQALKTTIYIFLKTCIFKYVKTYFKNKMYIAYLNIWIGEPEKCSLRALLANSFQFTSNFVKILGKISSNLQFSPMVLTNKLGKRRDGFDEKGKL